MLINLQDRVYTYNLNVYTYKNAEKNESVNFEIHSTEKYLIKSYIIRSKAYTQPNGNSITKYRREKGCFIHKLGTIKNTMDFL